MARRPGSAHTAAPLRLAALLLLALASCVSNVEPAPPVGHDRIAVAELAQWEQAHGPLLRCEAQLPSLAWEVAPQETLTERCGTAHVWSGCFSFEVGYPLPTPTITLAEGNVLTDWQLYVLERHEVTHFLLHCSGYDPTGDPEHDGPWWTGLL